jgi:hypothetical protein
MGAGGGTDADRPPLQPSDYAVRARVQRCTVDIVPTDSGIIAAVGDGVGDPPAVATITPATAVVLLERASDIDERTVWATQAWPLAC